MYVHGWRTAEWELSVRRRFKIAKALKQFKFPSCSFHCTRNASCDAQGAQESQNAKTNGPDHSNENVFTRQLPHLRHREISHFWHVSEVVELVDLKQKPEKNKLKIAQRSRNKKRMHVVEILTSVVYALRGTQLRGLTVDLSGLFFSGCLCSYRVSPFSPLMNFVTSPSADISKRQKPLSPLKNFEPEAFTRAEPPERDPVPQLM